MLPVKKHALLAFTLSLLFLRTTTVPAEVPTSQSSPSTTTRPTVDARDVTFATDDGIEIQADYVPPRPSDPPGSKAPVVILLHEYAKDRSSFAPLLPHLHDAGFAVLAIDLRGHGQSAGPPGMNLAKRVADRDPRLFREMYRDVQAAYLWLADRPEVEPGRLTLVGASVGCSVALNYAARDRSVDGVVCLTLGTKYLGIDSARDAKKYGQRPLLLLASEPEREAADALGKLLPQATVQIVPGRSGDPTALHGSRMLGQVPGIEQTIVEFLLKATGPPATQPVVASVSGGVYHSPDSPTVRRIKRANLRQFSSPAEAEARGLRAAKSRTKNP